MFISDENIEFIHEDVFLLEKIPFGHRFRSSVAMLLHKKVNLVSMKCVCV